MCPSPRSPSDWRRTSPVGAETVVTLEHLWATWRSDYVRSAGTGPSVDDAGVGSLFERILGSGEPDDRTLIVRRGPTCFVLLNRFPYTSGHLMVLPYRAVADLSLLDPDEHSELWATVRTAVAALRVAFDCDAVNVGLNLGRAAGGSQSDHLHVHCVPRWEGDANFMTVAAGTRVLPVSLEEAWSRLRDAWPAAGP
jgi:ATP adenylyltransferase